MDTRRFWESGVGETIGVITYLSLITGLDISSRRLSLLEDTKTSSNLPYSFRNTACTYRLTILSLPVRYYSEPPTRIWSCAHSDALNNILISRVPYNFFWKNLHTALPTELNIDEPNTGYINPLSEVETLMPLTSTG